MSVEKASSEHRSEYQILEKIVSEINSAPQIIQE